MLSTIPIRNGGEGTKDDGDHSVQDDKKTGKSGQDIDPKKY